MPSMKIVWLIAAVVFGIAEGATMGLTAVWFAGGSLAAMFVAIFGGALWIQIVVFIVVSAVVLYLTRDLAKKYINQKHERTNADRVVGMEGIVIEPIDNEQATGQIRVAGQVWTARSSDDSAIGAGARVNITSIEGVKAMVVRKAVPAAPQNEQ